MHFKLLFILVFSVFLKAQSYYESSIGIEYSSYNARSLAMSSSFSDGSALCLISNPSNLSIGDNNRFSIISSYLGNSKLERRSIVIKDSFEDYLTEADYVRNIDFNSSYAIGLKYNKDIGEVQFSLAISYVPYKNYNYNYKEEIRGSLPSNDGDIFSRDPFLGNHILESKGTQYLYSFGSSLDFKMNKHILMSFGLSLNTIKDAVITEIMNIDILPTDDDISGYFSDIIPYNIKYDLEGSSFFTFGYRLQSHKYLLGLSFEESAKIKNNLNGFTYNYLDMEVIETLDGLLDTTYNIIPYDILYMYMEVTETLDGSLDTTYNSIMVDYISDYLELKTSDIEKPQKYGFSFSIMNPNKNNMSFILSYEKYKYEKSYILTSNEKYSLGIEHYTINNTALRFGLEYKTSPFKPYISSTSAFTFGAGYKINRFVFDIGGKYSLIQYNFPDLYSVIDNFSKDLDIINESNVILVGTISYQF
jgi:hypothetical protein